jgi:hypothetical protein
MIADLYSTRVLTFDIRAEYGYVTLERNSYHGGRR